MLLSSYSTCPCLHKLCLLKRKQTVPWLRSELGREQASFSEHSLTDGNSSGACSKICLQRKRGGIGRNTEFIDKRRTVHILTSQNAQAVSVLQEQTVCLSFRIKEISFWSHFSGNGVPRQILEKPHFCLIEQSGVCPWKQKTPHREEGYGIMRLPRGRQEFDAV